MTANFSAWKEGAVHYLPTFFVGLICLYFALKGYRGFWVAVVLFGAYAAFSLFFFRDPPRQIKAAAGEVVSPADGTIVGIEDLKETPYYEGPCKRVSIFLSVMNVHVNRAPYGGTVESVQYKPGKFGLATDPICSERNESNAVHLATDHGPMTVRQISGAVARRIVCKAKPGETIEKGQRFGMIKLGSRTELFLPPDTAVCVTLKEKVQAGTTIVAKFK